LFFVSLFFAIEILSAVTHACAVERINKGHGFIHSKARASMGNRTTIDALFTFTNESLLHKKTTMPGVIGSFEAYISSLSIPSEEIDDVMSTLSSVEVGDYLPAERSDPVPTRRRRQPARARADGDDDDDGDEEMSDGDGDADGSSLDEEEGEDSDADTDEDEDEGDYVYIKTAEVPDGFEKVVVAEPVAYIPDSALDGFIIAPSPLTSGKALLVPISSSVGGRSTNRGELEPDGTSSI
jgi:hypothetical protein